MSEQMHILQKILWAHKKYTNARQAYISDLEKPSILFGGLFFGSIIIYQAKGCSYTGRESDQLIFILLHIG